MDISRRLLYECLRINSLKRPDFWYSEITFPMRSFQIFTFLENIDYCRVCWPRNPSRSHFMTVPNLIFSIRTCHVNGRRMQQQRSHYSAFKSCTFFSRCLLVQTHNSHVPVQRPPFHFTPTKHCEPALSSSPLNDPLRPHQQLPAPHPPSSLNPTIYKTSADHSPTNFTPPGDNVQLHQLRHPHHKHPPPHPRPHNLHPSPPRHLHPRRRRHDRPPLRVRLRRPFPNLHQPGKSAASGWPGSVEGLSLWALCDAECLG